MKLCIIILSIAWSTHGVAQTLASKIDSLFSSYGKKTPGAAITILRNGKVLAKKSYGMASLEFSVPFNHNTVVRLPYSEAREFISIGAAFMEKDGLISLNDKVRKYFPQLPGWSEEVTIQDLLNHSSGFDDEWATLALTQASMANRLDKSQFLNFLYNQPTPAVPPKSGYMYSNSDFALLRLIMETASGENLATYMERRIFKPLKMTATRILNDKEEVITNRAFSYYTGPNNSYRLWLQDKSSPGGNYVVVTSANDLEKWAIAHADRNSMISVAINQLKQNARSIPVLPGTNYVFGIKHRRVGPNEALIHMGVSDHPYMAIVPKQGLSIIYTTNMFKPHWIEMENLLEYSLNITSPKKQESHWPGKAIDLPNPDLKSYAGTYKWDVPLTFQSYVPRKRLTHFVVENESLRWVYAINDTITMMPVAKNIFKDPEYPVWIRFTTEGNITKGEMFEGYSDDTIRLEKVGSATPEIQINQLQKLIGKYYSKHLDFYLTIQLNDKNQLIVKRPTVADKVIEPFNDGEFRLMMDYGIYESEGWIKFFYNENGKVSHFTVTHPRLMGHRFDKVE